MHIVLEMLQWFISHRFTLDGPNQRDGSSSQTLMEILTESIRFLMKYARSKSATGTQYYGNGLGLHRGAARAI